MRFEFATAARIIFGPGTLNEIGSLAASLGHRAMVVVGTSAGTQNLLDLLQEKKLQTHTLRVRGEPTTDLVRQGTGEAQREGCDLVIGYGGGSALDTAKAVAALLANEGDPLDYLEVIGKGKPLREPSLPCIAIPTTAGTGAEVTRNAVLASPEHRVKVSLRSPFLLPRLALVDPELTHSLPPAVTASTGLDALTQLLEAFVSIRANPLTDALCQDGLGRAARSLERAYLQGDDRAARQDMSLASLFGGLALANAGLGAVHGFAGVIGGMFPAPHGAICARLLPFVMESNVRSLQMREPAGRHLERYEQVARLLIGNNRATIADGVGWVQRLCAALAVPSLVSYGITPADIPVVVEKTMVASSTQANPVRLEPEELSHILAQAL